MRTFGICLLAVTLLPSALLAGPKVEIVVAKKAPALEQRAAAEVAALLKRLYQAEVTEVAIASGSSPSIIIGNPTTNPALEFAKADWPKLTDQGHIVKSTRHLGQPALIIGGSSPAATYWAACEYAHHLGVRTMLYGDHDPIAPPEFSLDGIDLKLDSSLPIRAWELNYESPMSFAAWTKDEQVAFVRQLAKLKFNRLVLRVAAAQPFISFRAAGIERKEGKFWNQQEFPVDGDTAGRSAFGGKKFFDNPDFVNAKNEAERRSAAQAILRAVISEAESLGMQTAFHIEPYDLPPEFDRRRVHDDAELAGECARATVRAYVESFAEIDAVMIGVRAYYPHTPEFFGDAAIWLRPDRSKVQVLSFADDPLDALQAWQKAIPQSQESVMKGLNSVWSILDHTPVFRLPNGQGAISRELPIASVAIGPVPQVAHAALVEVVLQLQENRWKGHQVQSQAGIGSMDLSAYILCRNTFGGQLSSAKACEGLLTPICGDEVHTRVSTAFETIEGAARKLEKESLFLELEPAHTLKHYAKAELPPERWQAARDAYLSAMNEMYRANTRAREGSRSYTLYLARQFEFGFEYMNCLQAVRNAGVAKKAGDNEKQIAELEKAIDSINSACNALAAVARSNSDRGLIAVLNAEIYRPLVKELEKADAE